MAGMDWIFLKHNFFVHLPIAAALLLPAALIAAQRSGRGIKPWWITCRYLAWAGVLGAGLAVFTGFWTAQATHRLPAGVLFSKGPFSPANLFQMHQWLALASLLWGAFTLRALHRKRDDHQGIGIVGLFLGLLWAGTTLGTGYYGILLGHPPAPKPEVPATKPMAIKPVDLEPLAPLRALDYGSLIPMHLEPVKSSPHGNRWIRVWSNRVGESAYRAGETLPEGSLVVMSTTEDRWGRPGHDPGPLYALEMKSGGKSSLTFYWARVPEARRNESRGADRVYWRGDDENLKDCLACHASGIAQSKDRSKWASPKAKPKAESD